MNDKSVFQ